MTATLTLAMNALTSSGLLLAAEDSSGIGLLVQHLLAAVVFSAVGIVVLALSFWIMEKLTPFSLVKEIEEDQNVALGIVLGAIAIGISLIIAAAILG
jgi:uncharacterized membrane protein YjfL (UPF0719 family)